MQNFGILVENKGNASGNEPGERRILESLVKIQRDSSKNEPAERRFWTGSGI